MVCSWLQRDTIAVRFPVGRVLVEGPSMVPALHHGDQGLVGWPRRPAPRAGSVVLVDMPGERGLGIKRLVAVEPSGGLRLAGDNPTGSTDSRQFGPVPLSALRGRVVLRLWPRPGRISAASGTNGPPSHSH